MWRTLGQSSAHRLPQRATPLEQAPAIPTAHPRITECDRYREVNFAAPVSGADYRSIGEQGPADDPRLGGQEETSQNVVAIEFIEPAPRFWHIDFPPAELKVWKIEGLVSSWDSPPGITKAEQQ
jgi:hypothetical protein